MDSATPPYQTFEWMGITCPLFDQVYPRVVMPEWAQRRKLETREQRERRQAWEDEELRRCYDGYGPFCGSYYFYYHYCFIKGVTGGKIRPNLRMTDNLDFILEETVERECTGYVKPKARRNGATWRCAATDVRRGVLFPYKSSGYSSEDDKKGKEYIQRCGYIFDNLPPFLKAHLLNRNNFQLFWAKEEKDEFGNPTLMGNQSMLEARAPGNVVWEAYGKNCVKQDEAGKLSGDIDLEQWIINTAPILAGNDGFKRAGYMGIFGTVGDMKGTAGERFKAVYKNAENYNLRQFWIPGTWALDEVPGVDVRFQDEFGNNDFDVANEWLDHEYKKCKTRKTQIAFLQQYPRCEEDCFAENADQHFLDLTYIEKMEENILEKNPEIKVGKFMLDSMGNVLFHPTIHGHVEILEEPIRPGPENMYAGGVDPVDHGEGAKSAVDLFKKKQVRSSGLSDLAFIIYKRKPEFGGMADYPVCIYSNRESDERDAYMQAILAAMYYGCRLAVEQNRRGFIIWAKTAGYATYLAGGLDKTHKAAPGTSYEHGYNKDNTTKDMLADFVVRWLPLHWHKQYFGKLASQLRKYLKGNTDLVEALSGALFLCSKLDQMEARSHRFASEYEPQKKIMPVQKWVNGRLTWIR